MKRIIIVRHGAFNHHKPGVLDAGHPLNRRGRHEAAAAADRFAELHMVPNLVLTSPARRALETTDIFQKKMKLPEDRLRVETEIYEAERAEILRIIHRLKDSFNTVMLVGHNPGMTSLLHHLVDSDIAKMPSSSFAVVELDVNSWQHVSFRTAKLVHYSAPEVKPPPRFGWWRRFTFWRRQREQKVELFVIFLIGLLVILGIIALIVSSSTNPEAMPRQGSMGRTY